MLSWGVVFFPTVTSHHGALSAHAGERGLHHDFHNWGPRHEQEMRPAFPSRTSLTAFTALLLAALPCTLCLEVRHARTFVGQQGKHLPACDPALYGSHLSSAAQRISL